MDLEISEPHSLAFGYRKFSYVYVIEAGRFVKIGRSFNPNTRVDAIRAGASWQKSTGTRCPSSKVLPPDQLRSAVLVRAWKVDDRVVGYAERRAHTLLAKRRVSHVAGEWFKCSAADVERIWPQVEVAWRDRLTTVWRSVPFSIAEIGGAGRD